MPIIYGKGASRMSIMVDGRIGMRVCFQENGKMKDAKQLITYVNRALCFDIIKIFLSRRIAENISKMLSTLRHLNKLSTSSLFTNGGC